MIAGTLHRGLDVVHAGRFAPHADGGREGRLGTWVGASAFEGVDQRGFFTADVAPGAGVDEQLEIKTGAQDVLAQQAGGLGFFHGTVQVLGGGGVFAAQEDVATVGLQRTGADQHAFDQQMGQLLHQHAVLPGVGFHFIRVAQQVADVDGFVLGIRPHFTPVGEARTAATLETGVFHGLDDVVAGHVGEGLTRGGVAVLGLVLVQPHRFAVVTQTPGQGWVSAERWMRLAGPKEVRVIRSPPAVWRRRQAGRHRRCRRRSSAPVPCRSCPGSTPAAG